MCVCFVLCWIYLNKHKERIMIIIIIQSQAKNDFIHSKFWLRMILFIAGYGRFCFRFDPMIGEREREKKKQEREVRRDGWRGWCKSRRKALVKLNSHEPRVSLNSIPEM